MKDDRVLKKVIGKPDELYSFCVNYRTDGDLYGMYVWASNVHDAGREVLKVVPGAKIGKIKLGWPR